MCVEYFVACELPAARAKRAEIGLFLRNQSPTSKNFQEFEKLLDSLQALGVTYGRLELLDPPLPARPS